MTAPVVVKVGGHALGTPEDLDTVMAMVAADAGALVDAGTPVVVVHGGGPQIDRDLAAAGIDVETVDGLRVTSEAAVDVVATVLARVNGQIVEALARHGRPARSVLGRHGLLCARELGSPWGRVGTDVVVDPAHLTGGGPIPVVDPVATDTHGRLLNCNADVVAGAISSAVGARALVLLSDVSQVREDPRDPATALRSLSRAQAEELRERGGIVGGMVPKLAAAIEAVSAGAQRVVIADARQPHALADALAGIGEHTEVYA